jgi:uncharacterized protein YecT (DUF1311 family)
MKFIGVFIFCVFLSIYSCNSKSKLIGINHEIEKDTLDEAKSYSPEVEKKLLLNINKDAHKLKSNLIKQSFSNERVRFMVDTFKIVEIRKRKMEYLYSTQEMNQLVNEEFIQYDKLMNYYYNKLLSNLDTEDKEILVSAQKAWLEFRDREINLCSALRAEKYSGGGTIQSNIFTGLKCDLTRNRLNELFEHSCMEN